MLAYHLDHIATVYMCYILAMFYYTCIFSLVNQIAIKLLTFTKSSDMPNKTPKVQKMVRLTDAAVTWLAIATYIATKLQYQVQAKN